MEYPKWSELNIPCSSALVHLRAGQSKLRDQMLLATVKSNRVVAVIGTEITSLLFYGFSQFLSSWGEAIRFYPYADLTSDESGEKPTIDRKTMIGHSLRGEILSPKQCYPDRAVLNRLVTLGV